MYVTPGIFFTRYTSLQSFKISKTTFVVFDYTFKHKFSNNILLIFIIDHKCLTHDNLNCNFVFVFCIIIEMSIRYNPAPALINQNSSHKIIHFYLLHLLLFYHVTSFVNVLSICGVYVYKCW